MEIDSSIAWDKEEKLIDDRIMDSFMVEQIGKMLCPLNNYKKLRT